MISQTDDTDNKADAGNTEKEESGRQPSGIKTGTVHIGSSNAFEETEDPGPADPDGITDKRLDELTHEYAAFLKWEAAPKLLWDRKRHSGEFIAQ